MNRSYAIALVVIIVSCITVPSYAKPVDYGKQLANLRAEVDEFESRLERIRSEGRAERTSLQTQKTKPVSPIFKPVIWVANQSNANTYTKALDI